MNIIYNAKTLILFLLFGINFLYSQEFDAVKTIKQAEKYVADYEKNAPQIVKLFIQRDSLDFYKKKLDHSNIKILSIDTTFKVRAKIIAFFKSKIETDSINRIKDTIMKSLNEGIKFDDLAEKYTMQNDKQCDTYWIDRDNMITNFAYAVRKHKVGDIFFFDDDLRKIYLIILKTHNHIDTFKITYLKKEKINLN